jgi:hypothetical protein
MEVYLSEYRRESDADKRRSWGEERLNPATRSFWMIPKLSSIVIINLIANLTFLYHKPKKHAVTRID